jgi:hypothetical protein
MMKLTELIRHDETFGKIQNGKCSKCNEPYALITGSNKTFHRDGRRYAHINFTEIGLSAFRCKKCSECIEETWVAVDD